MSRTTLNIDEPILRDLRRLQKEEKKPLGRLVSELLAWAIRTRSSPNPAPRPFVWTSRRMGARIDLEDKDALWAALDEARDDSIRAPESPGGATPGGGCPEGREGCAPS